VTYQAKHPAAFINILHEDGTKAEAVEWLQRIWDELQDLRQVRGTAPETRTAPCICRSVATLQARPDCPVHGMRQEPLLDMSGEPIDPHPYVPHVLKGAPKDRCHECGHPEPHPLHTLNRRVE
jgi:hypothetical protein